MAPESVQTRKLLTMAVATAVNASPTADVITDATMITPKTGHPFPRTSSRERPNASKTPACSMTITDAMTAQAVNRMMPGTNSKTKPRPTARPHRRADADQGSITGAADFINSPTKKSRWPALTSHTSPYDCFLIERYGNKADRKVDRKQRRVPACDTTDDRYNQKEPERHWQQHDRLVAVGRENLAEDGADV